MSLATIGLSNSNGLLTRSLQWLSERPLAELIFKDVTCFNAPKMALSRTGPELADVAELELSNTAVTFFASLLLPRFLYRAMGKFTGISPETLVKSVDALGEAAGKAVSKVKLGKLGASLAFYFPFAAGFWAVPFLRNYMTLARTNTTNFDAIVGLEGEKAASGGRSVEDEKAHQLGMVFKVLGTGLALGAASFFGFGKLANHFGQKALPKFLEETFSTLRLGGKNGNEIEGDMATLLFWSLPAYLGWIHAARTKNERIEQGVKALNSIMWFSVLNPVMNAVVYTNAFRRALGVAAHKLSVPNILKLIARKPIGTDKTGVLSYSEIFEKAYPPQKEAELLRLKNKQYGFGLLKSIVLLGTTPQLLNIYFTKRRHERALAAQQAARPAFANANPFLNGANRNNLQTMRIAVTPGLAIHAGSPFSVLTHPPHGVMG